MLRRFFQDRRRTFGLAGLAAAVLAALSLAVPLFAGIATGTVERADAVGGKLVLKVKGKSQTFTVPAKASVTIDNKKSSLNGIREGVSATVFTDASDRVTRVTVRTEAGKGAAGAARKPAKSESVAKKKPADEDSDDVPAPTPRPRPRTGRNTQAVRPSEPAADGDWPQFDGPQRDNVSRETGLLKTWPEEGPRLLWTAEGLGQGYSSVSVARGKIFSMGNVRDDEAVIAIDLATGNVLWTTPIARASRLSAGDGPRSTPTVDGDQVYALGGNGDLARLDAATGKIDWQKNILSDFGAQNIEWGICESVLIDGERLICTPGGRQAAMVALNKESGDVIWRCQPPGTVKAGYASAVPADVKGVRQYIQFTAAGTMGVRAADGTFLWGDDGAANPTANCSSPLVFEDLVFSASGYGKGGALVRLQSGGNKTQAALVYKTQDMKNHHGGMVLVDGHVYGSNDPGIMMCLDLKSGNVRWQDRSVGKGAVTCADGHIYLRSENGPVALIEANSSEYREKGRFDQPNRSGANSWPHPVVAQGKLFLRDQDVLLCYDVKE